MSTADGRRSGRRPGAAPRTFAVIVLLALAAVGFRAREAARSVATAGPLARHAVVLAITVAGIAVLAGVALLVALALMLQRPSDEEEQREPPRYGTRWSRPLAVLAGLAVIGATLQLVQVSTRPIADDLGGVRAPSRAAPRPGQQPPETVHVSSACRWPDVPL
jgi:hypothetical protein